MTTVLEYLEEETPYLPDIDIPAHLATAEISKVVTALFTFSTEYEEEGEGEAQKYEVLELTTVNDDTFIVISPDKEEWFYYPTIDDYIEKVLEEFEDLSYDYEVVSDEDF